MQNRDRFGAVHVATPMRADTVCTPKCSLQQHLREPDARRRLEAILHPMIRAESARQCVAAGGPYVILAVPLLVESGGYRERCDRICVVDCPEALQLERVRARNGLAYEQIRAIMAAQASRAQRLAAADDVIDNAGTLASLHAQVDRLHAAYLAATTH